jgi:hypothetical protein
MLHILNYLRDDTLLHFLLCHEMKVKDIVALSEQLNKKAFYRTEASGTM